jgi:hypothetical protein
MGIGGRIMTWVPEFIAIFIAISFPFRTATNKQIHLPGKYVIFLSLYLGHIFMGFWVNDVTGWTILSGLRIYTKFIPIFLVPIIYPFSERTFKNFILWIFAFSMLQLPVVLWQRFIKYATSLSGDLMGGTLGVSTSGVLAVYLAIVISFLIAFYLKKEISLSVFLISTAAAFIPITLNETKVSFALLPIAFLLPAFFLKGQRETIFRVLVVVVLLILSFVIFKNVYDHFAEKRWGYGITRFIKTPGRLDRYNLVRTVPIRQAIINATKEPRFAFFGRGAGNVSKGFTRKLSGKYVKEGRFYNVSFAITKLIWEIGIMGTLLFLLFPCLIFLDASRLCKQEGIFGAFSLGMLSFSVFFSFSLFYTFTLDSNLLIFLFFLCAGHLVSKSVYTEEDYLEPNFQSMKLGQL